MMSALVALETVRPKIPEANLQGHASEATVPSASVRRLILDRRLQSLGVLLLLISASFTEVATNVVYVVVIEQAYQLGNGATAIGIVLIVQAAAQVIFGSWAGGLADRWGFRKAAGIAALAASLLLPVLAIAQDILIIYTLAFFLMLARLLFIPARFGLVSQVSDRTKLIQTNTAILILAGAGSFVGPAIAAALLFATDDLALPLLVAGSGWLLSVPPLMMMPLKTESSTIIRRRTFLGQFRTGWRLILKRQTIGQVLICLIITALILGAITPLFTPLSRQLGLGAEGTGVFFSALGFGYLMGPVFATMLFKRIRLSSALLIAGLLAPVGLLLVSALDHIGGVLIAIALVSAAGASLNVIVTTITQRLTPPDRRGSVLGAEQTIIGLAWIVSLGAVTGITATWDSETNVGLLFLILASLSFALILGCWFWNRRSIQVSCDKCEPRFRLSPLVCWNLQGAPLGLSGVACGLLCGKECQCCS